LLLPFPLIRSDFDGIADTLEHIPVSALFLDLFEVLHKPAKIRYQEARLYLLFFFLFVNIILSADNLKKKLLLICDVNVVVFFHILE